MYSRILVPTDFSKASFAAFKPAITIARKFGGKIWLLHVSEIAPVYAYRFGISQQELDERVIEHVAGEMRNAAKILGVKGAELIIRSGKVQQEIVNVVNEKKIDLIVMGTHGMSGLVHAVLGSVTDKVVRLAPCHVLTVKPR
ncbi:MAG: universal stress protein [Ignavibacteriae bacterium]|nr:universal stress protein [Ignavibacteriota bacterium]